MQIAVDLSLYPLDENYIPPIKDFIERLQAYEHLEVWTNAMSTQVIGDYELVMDTLKHEIGATFSELPKAVFAMKILNNPGEHPA